MSSSMQGSVISGITPPAPPHPPAVPSHKTPIPTTVAQTVSPPPNELASSSKEERIKSSSSGVVQSPKDLSPSAKLNNGDGENPGADVSPSNNINKG